jgi:CIC family chloride channel protein
MDKSFVAVGLDSPAGEVLDKIEEANDFGAVVLDDGDLLAGIVTLSDFEEADIEDPARLAKHLMTRDVITCTPDETLDEVLRRPGARDVRRIPVVEGPRFRRVVGMLRRREVLSAYARAAGEHAQLLQHVRSAQIREAGGPKLINLRVGRGSKAAESSLAELPIPHGCLLVSVQSGMRERIPSGETVLHAGDQVLAVVRPGQEKEFRALFAAEKH